MQSCCRGQRPPSIVGADMVARLSALFRRGIRHQAVNLSPLVLFRKVFGDGETFGTHEEQTVAVLTPLHLVAGTNPVTARRQLGCLIRIEVARTERTAELVDVCRQPEHDGFGDVPIGVNRRAALLAIFRDVSADPVQGPISGSSVGGLRFVHGGTDSPAVTGLLVHLWYSRSDSTFLDYAGLRSLTPPKQDSS